MGVLGGGRQAILLEAVITNCDLQLSFVKVGAQKKARVARKNHTGLTAGFLRALPKVLTVSSGEKNRLRLTDFFHRTLASAVG